jgi:hypothetical protein
LNERRTHAELADTARQYLESLKRPYRERSTSDLAAGAAVPSPPVKQLLHRNVVGESMVAMAVRSWERALLGKCRENVNLAATQTVLAMKCQERESGSLPESLEELVPAWLRRVPMDDFTGKPLRYSKAQQLLYSLGDDLLDSGGIAIGADGVRKDVPFAIGP